MTNLNNKITKIKTSEKGFKSLSNLEWLNIPDFAVITGLNGSGKTQLLEAFDGAKIKSSNGYQLIKSEEVFIEFKIGDNCRTYYIDVNYQPRIEKYSATKKIEVQEVQRAYYGNSNTPKIMTIEEDIEDLDSKIIENITKYITDYIEDKSSNQSGKPISLKEQALKFLMSEFKLTEEELSKNINNTLKEYSTKSSGYSIIATCLYHLDYLTQRIHEPKTYNNKMNLDDALSRLFVIHHKCKKDLLKKIQHFKEIEMLKIDEAQDLDSKVEEYFNKKDHPCDLINNVLNKCRENYKENFNLKYNIIFDEEKLVRKNEAIIFLKDLENNQIREFENLSSGEKVIISLLVKFFTIPKLDCVDVILVDEFDAFLNPQMASMYINIMYDVFYLEYGKQVILTTHSPSTVSYVDEESLFWMENGKINKDEKINVIHKLAFGYLPEENACPFASYLIDPRKKYYILVEGYTDILHFKNACKVLGSLYQEKIWNNCNFINLGGTKEVYARTFINNFGFNKKIISIFDNDKSGIDIFEDLFKNVYEFNKVEKNIRQINKDSIGIVLKESNDNDYENSYSKQIELGYITIEMLYPKFIVDNFNNINNGFLRNIRDWDDLKLYYKNPGKASNIENCFVVEKDKLKLKFAKEHIKTLNLDHYKFFIPTLNLILEIINNWEK